MKSMKKTIALAVAISMIFGCVVGGTLAWLTAKSTDVKNVFTPSTIGVTLAETDSDDTDTDAANNSYKMVPGATITKNPIVTVTNGSEACYLFVKVSEVNAVDTFLTYDVIPGWDLVPGEANIYYRQVPATSADTPFNVIYYDVNNNDTCDSGEEHKVFVNTSVTKDMMDGLGSNAANYPKIEVTAYAVQSANLTDQNNDNKVDAEDAWKLAPKE